MTISVRYGRFEAYRSLGAGQSARPYVPVRLYDGGRYRDTVGLVDSGADVTVFNLGFADLLGVDLSGVLPKPFAGVVNGRPATAQYVRLGLSIYGERFFDQVGFSSAVGVEHGYLGRTGFFRACAIGFDERQQRLLSTSFPSSRKKLEFNRGRRRYPLVD